MMWESRTSGPASYTLLKRYASQMNSTSATNRLYKKVLHRSGSTPPQIGTPQDRMTIRGTSIADDDSFQASKGRLIGSAMPQPRGERGSCREKNQIRGGERRRWIVPGLALIVIAGLSAHATFDHNAALAAPPG